MALTNQQTAVLMATGEFHKQIQIAAIKVAAVIRDEVIGDDMPLVRHQKRFALATRFLNNSEAMSRTHAPSTAVALAEYLDWPDGHDNPQEAAAALANAIPAETMTAVLAANVDFIAGWDATGEAWQAANP